MNVKFTKSQMASINEMNRKLKVKTPKLFKLAFSLLQIAIREVKSGNTLAIMDNGGKMLKEIVLK